MHPKGYPVVLGNRLGSLNGWANYVDAYRNEYHLITAGELRSSHVLWIQSDPNPKDCGDRRQV